ncbi:MAG TPA: LysR substrate-binding domain-containing protein [Acidobacteriaceae bacterium]|jgi:DNA-binding transcriptional LysR family regulator|nr:LysR substrate-binding domain-containing protein [Acidobacteriaceae bacterium]
MSDSVEFRHLVYLLAIHEGKNFTKAAERVYRSQPAVSQQIRALEDDIGFPIFIRGRGRADISPTRPGKLVLRWARRVLKERREIFLMARAIYDGDVPPLRFGFSPFVNPLLLESLRNSYEELFPGCEIHLSSGDTRHTLQRLDQGDLDCALLPMPVDRDLWNVLQVAQSPLVLCMRANDPLASHSQVDIHEAAPRITIFRDPELHAAAHSRLSEMFVEAGITMHIANSAATPADMQWMVKQNYGLALVDQLSALEPGLITRPIAGVNWTADTAFVAGKRTTHMALPLLEEFLRENGLRPKRKQPRPERIQPEQLTLIV